MRHSRRSPLRRLGAAPQPGRQQSQDSGITAGLLYLEQFPDLTHGLTPNRLRRILRDADAGIISEQHALFADMEERCDHLAAEMGKRKRSLLTLEWDILPAVKDDAKAREAARQLRAMVDALPSVDDIILDMADAIGHGFSALEIEWQYSDGWHIPKALTFRPQSWFVCPWRDRNVLHLRDGSAEGAELWPCGWIVHTHKSRSGWLPRAGLFRVLAWTYLIRAYAASSEVQYVQIHGLPLRLGKYPPGSTDADKTALLNALRCLGQDAAGIIPVGMEVIFQSPAANARDIPGELVTRCEQGMSKAILGGTLTSQADGKTSTNALGEIHEQVRRDILSADARQIAATLTEQLLRPLAMLNLGITDRRALPWWQFDTQDAADLSLYAEALPKLAPYMRISRRYVHERLKLPEAVSEDDVFQSTATPDEGDVVPLPEAATDGGLPRRCPQPLPPSGLRMGRAEMSAATAAPVASEGECRTGRAAEPYAEKGASANIDAKAQDRSAQAHAATQTLESMHAEEALTAAGESILRPLLDELANGLTPEELRGRLAELYPRMDAGELADILARAMFVAEVWGRVSADD